MRRALVFMAAALGVAAMLLVAGLLVLSRQGPELVRARAEAALGEAVGAPVTCGGADFRLTGRGLHLSLASLAAGGEGEAAALSVARADARVGLLALLRGELELRSLHLVEPRARLRQRPEGIALDLPGRAGADASGEPIALPRRLRLERAEIRVVGPRGRPLLELRRGDLSVRRALLGLGDDVQVELAGDLSGSALPLRLPRLALSARVRGERVDAGTRWRLRGDLALDRLRAPLEAELLQGAAGEPLRVQVRSRGAALADLKPLLALQTGDVRPRLRFLETAEAGRVEDVDVAWARDAGPRIALSVVDAAFPVGTDDRLEALHARLVLTRDRLEVEDARADFDGRPLPRASVSLSGLRHIEAADELRCVRPAPTGPLAAQRFLETREGESRSAWSRARVELDWLEHPLLLCTVERLAAALEPRPGGFDATVERAVWAGVPVTARAEYRTRPESGLDLEVSVGPPFEPMRTTVRSGAWAQGRVRLEASRLGAWRILGAESRVRARGTEVAFEDARVPLTPESTLEVDASFDLRSPDHVPYRLHARVARGRIEDLASALDLPAANVTGTLTGALVLAGDLREGEAFLAGADGFVTAQGRDGVVRAQLPVFLAIADLGRSLNPFADRDAYPYRALDAFGHVRDGRLQVEPMYLDGRGMRLVATGEISLLSPFDLDVLASLHFFRRLDRMIGFVPLLSRVLLGGDDNLVGAYFQLQGPWRDVDATLLPTKTLATGPASFVLEGVPAFVRGSLGQLRTLVRAPAGAPDEAGS